MNNSLDNNSCSNSIHKTRGNKSVHMLSNHKILLNHFRDVLMSKYYFNFFFFMNNLMINSNDEIFTCFIPRQVISGFDFCYSFFIKRLQFLCVKRNIIFKKNNMKFIHKKNQLIADRHTILMSILYFLFRLEDVKYFIVTIEISPDKMIKFE